MGTVFRTCERHGITLAFVKGGVPEGEFGDVAVYLEGWSGHKQRESIIEAAGRGQQAKMRGAGGAPARPLGRQVPPFVTRWVEQYEVKRGLNRPMKRRFEEDPERIEARRLIFRLYDEGHSLRAVGGRLRELGGTGLPSTRNAGRPRRGRRS